MPEPTQTDDLLDAIAKILLRCWIFGFILLLFWWGAVSFIIGWLAPAIGAMGFWGKN